MSYDVLDKLAVPIAVGFLSTLISLIVWRKNTKKDRILELCKTCINDISESLSELYRLVDKNYSSEFRKNSFEKIYERILTTTEFANLPQRIRTQLKEVFSLISNYKDKLNCLTMKSEILEELSSGKGYSGNITEYYILDFIMLDKCPKSEMVINFPSTHGSFMSLYCSEQEIKLIYNKSRTLEELNAYIKAKNEFKSKIYMAIKLIDKYKTI